MRRAWSRGESWSLHYTGCPGAGIGCQIALALVARWKNYTKYNDPTTGGAFSDSVPVNEAYRCPAVIYDERSEVFHMWYNWGPFEIGYATSPDGINWAPYHPDQPRHLGLHRIRGHARHVRRLWRHAHGCHLPRRPVLDVLPGQAHPSVRGAGGRPRNLARRIMDAASRSCRHPSGQTWQWTDGAPGPSRRCIVPAPPWWAIRCTSTTPAVTESRGLSRLLRL